MATIRHYLSLIKFSHTIFAMPFALIGFFLGWLRPPAASFDSLLDKFQENQQWGLLLKYLGLVILCMIFARSAAMAFNRYLDRHIDAKNPRTAVREIPRGIIAPKHALFFTILNGFFFVFTCSFINRVCFYLSPLALAVVLGYSYTKRFTALSHLVLGLGLSLAPIGAYLAVTGAFDLLPLLFSAAVLFWVSGFDIIYSLQDEEFDRGQNLHSIPARLGKAKALVVSALLHLFCVASIVGAGIYGEFEWLYWGGCAIFVAMLIYQHAIVRPDDLSRVNLAFMTANGIASVIFAVFVIADLFINS
ncbi:MAG TPA: UbiA-like polyprenyltransferase [Chitinophagaceae bacterium]|nr:UbiA-like polyprenyltransferase [Chitinophagaceae bacterium]